MDAGDRTISMACISATRCASVRREGCLGGLRSIKLAGPCSLNFTTQSRTIWTVMLPIAAASVRLAHS